MNSEHDIFDQMLEFEMMSPDTARIKWDRYRIAGFSTIANVNTESGIASFSFQDLGSSISGTLRLVNDTITLHIDSSDNAQIKVGDDYAYFGGVTRLLIPDNAKTATITNNRYEVVLNRSYQEMAEHYGTAIVPARVRKPDDKAAVEGSVRFVSTWITAALRDRKFFSIAEAKAAVQEKLEELNLRPFKKPRTGCRLSAYEQEEKDFMQPLPTHAYEPSVWLSPKVGYDYLVSDGLNKHSVPYDLIGKKVEISLPKWIQSEVYPMSRTILKFRGHRIPQIC